jgi:prevent-host-death family protein
MIDVTEDIQPLTTFRNNSVKMMSQLKRTKRPIVLTVNGRPAAVVQSPEAYQRLLDIAAKADEMEGIRQGLEDEKAGRVHSLAEVMDGIRAKHGFPR